MTGYVARNSRMLYGPQILTALQRPLGRWATIALGLILCASPAWLFYNPVSSHARDPIRVYRLRNDDYPYLSLSRTGPRTIENLFAPHATHIVPAWRLLTFGLEAAAGRLSRLPALLAWASYSIFVAVILLTGVLVARETGRIHSGLAAMLAVGTTSVMTAVATWYSAGQTLWAGFGVLMTLYYLQGWRRSGGAARLVMAAISAAFSGWFWTIGYLAGPLGSVYLWFDGRARCRKAAAIPLFAAVVAAAVSMGLGAHKIDSTISFHGRTAREAVDPVQGLLHTGQAITEDLLLGNLGLSGDTTAAQGAVITLAILLAWLWSGRRRGQFTPLEVVGAGFLFGSYFIVWTARGYLPFSSLRGILPWYDANPQIGAVLFVAGWWSGSGARKIGPTPVPATRFAGLMIMLAVVGQVALNRPRVEAHWWDTVPLLTPWETRNYVLGSQKSARTSLLALERARWQRRHLAKLEQAEVTARKLGIGREAIRRAFGRLDAPELPPMYDAVDLLDVPPLGSETNLARIRAAIGPLVTVEPEPRPPELPAQEAWP